MSGGREAVVPREAYFGIGIVSGKKQGNVGALARSAHAFGASMVFTIAFRSPRIDISSDTTKAARHLDLVEYASVRDFLRYRPPGCELVGVEFRAEESQPLPDFHHPPRALYLLGAEDYGLGGEALAACDQLVQVPSRYPLNVATAGSIVLYDRVAKSRIGLTPAKRRR